MPRVQRSVRVEPELIDELEELARQQRVPVTFAEQVDAGLRLLIDQAHEAQLRHSAKLVAADRQRAEQTHRRLRGQR